MNTLSRSHGLLFNRWWRSEYVAMPSFHLKSLQNEDITPFVCMEEVAKNGENDIHKTQAQ